MAEVVFTPAQLEVLAGLIADRLAERPRTQLVGVKQVAAYLACDASWVYEHALELGARRLGVGPKARLRFSLDEVDARLTTCTSSKGSSDAPTALPKGSRRRRSSAMGTSVELLPVHARSSRESRAA